MATLASKPLPTTSTSNPAAATPRAYWETASPAERTPTRVFERAKDVSVTVAREIADRVGGDPGFPGLFGGHAVPAARKPRRLALLEAQMWHERQQHGRR